MFIKYIILGFVFAAGIGPANIETAKRGLTDKVLSALFFYMGNVLIDALYILVVIFGFSIFIENVTIKIVLGAFGILYLLYLGIGDIRVFSQKKILDSDSSIVKRKLHPALEGILVNLANPTAVASWVAFYSVVPDDFVESPLNFLAVIIGAILVGLAIITVTHLFKKVIGEKVMRYTSLGAGVILIGFAAVFAYNLFIL